MGVCFYCWFRYFLLWNGPREAPLFFFFLFLLLFGYYCTRGWLCEYSISLSHTFSYNIIIKPFLFVRIINEPSNITCSYKYLVARSVDSMICIACVRYQKLFCVPILLYYTFDAHGCLSLVDLAFIADKFVRRKYLKQRSECWYILLFFCVFCIITLFTYCII